MAVRQSRGRYVVEFQQGGTRVFRRLPPGITQAQARELETKIRRELFDGQQLGRRDEITLPAAIGLWLQSNRRKNQRQAVSEARQWEPFVAGRLLREAPEVAQEAVGRWTSSPATAGRAGRAAAADLSSTPAAVAAHSTTYRTRAQESMSTGRATGTGGGVAPATINRRLALLKAVCKHAWKQGLIGENLSGRISLLREDNKREVYLTRAEVSSLAKSSTSVRARLAITILAYSGLRVSELLALTPGDLRKDSLTVRASKTGKPRIVPCAGPALRSVRAWFAESDSHPSYWQLHKEFLAAREAAGMPHIRIHDLRHTCASWLINAGVDLYTVGKILGHSGPQTTARYAHLSTATLEQAMRKLR